MSPDEARQALEIWSKDHSTFTDDEVRSLIGAVEGGGKTAEPLTTGKVTTLPEVKIVASKDDHTPFPDDAISTPLTRDPEPPNPVEHTGDRRDKFALISEGHDRWANNLFHPKESAEAKLSASGVKQLYRDPEYHAPTPQHDGLVGSLLHPLDSIAAATEKLPHFLGGGTEHMYEPSVQQFMRDEGPYLPPKFNQVHLDESSIEQSPEFRMYKDAQWAKAHDQAVKEGRSVARHEYIQSNDWKDMVRDKLVGAAGSGAAALHGAADAMTFGLAPKALDAINPGGAEGRQSLDESHPLAHDAGTLAGFASPGGFANELASGLGGVAGGVASRLGVKTLPRIVKAGAQGATAAGLDVTGRAGVNAASGQPVDWNDTARDAGIAMLLGGGMGMGADALGAGAGYHGKQLRKTAVPELPTAEAFGGKTSLLHGFVPGERYGKLVAEGEAMSPKVHPVSMLAQRLEEPIARASSDIASEGKAATGKVNSAFYGEHAHTQVPVDPLLDAATQLHEGLHDASGDVLPGPTHEKAAGMLRSEIAKMAETRMRPEGGRGVISFDEAEAKGHNIDHLFRGLDQDEIDMIRSGGLGQGVQVQPRAYNPEQVDKIVNSLDSALKAAQGPGGGPHPELERLLEASRAVRDQFPDSAHVPGGNWSEFKHQAYLKRAMEERAAAMAGTPGLLRGGGKEGREAPPLTAQEAKTQFNAIAGSGDFSSRHPEVDTALQGFAAKAGGNAPQDLADIARVKATEASVDKGKASFRVWNGLPMLNIPGSSARMRLDPILSRLALPTAEKLGGLRGGQVGGTGAYSSYRERPGPKPASLDEINRLLDPTQP